MGCTKKSNWHQDTYNGPQYGKFICLKFQKLGPSFHNFQTILMIPAETDDHFVCKYFRDQKCRCASFLLFPSVSAERAMVSDQARNHCSPSSLQPARIIWRNGRHPKLSGRNTYIF